MLKHLANEGAVAVDIRADLQKRGFAVTAGKGLHIGLGHDAGHGHAVPGQAFVAHH